MAQYHFNVDALLKVTLEPNETEITLPSQTRMIGEYAFKNCQQLRKIVLPENLRYIDRLTFSWCRALEEINFPDSLQDIGDHAFYHCHNLKKVIWGKGVQEIENTAFLDCGLEYIYIPETVEFIDETAFHGCEHIQQFDVSPDNPYFRSIDGSLYTKDGKILIRFACKKGQTSFQIPNFVTRIWQGAFYFQNPCQIVIPQSVVTIDNYVFEKGANLMIEDANHQYIKVQLSQDLHEDIMKSPLFLFVKVPTFKSFQKLPKKLQYQIAVTHYGTIPEIETFLRKRIVQVAKFFIEQENFETLEMLFEKGFITQKNVDAVLAHVINHAQETRNFEFQVAVMNYREKYLGYSNPEYNFKL
ncbi:MAG: leucine-rich repeat protein [Oscillospiraceae bacterium]